MEMETNMMKTQLSFTALGLVLATTALGFATVGHPSAVSPRETTPVRVANGASTGAPPRVYCYSGVKGEPGSLYRGWVCLPEHPPSVTN
jgi:hypothetical protein